jgi:photosystem II stability/assembly factor-like uncharacterized protein
LGESSGLFYFYPEMKTLTTAVLIFCAVVFAQAQGNKVENILTDIPSSFRALSVVNDQHVWASGSKGHVASSMDGGKTWKIEQVKGFEKLDFRSCYAFDDKKVIIANAGEPAHILKTIDGGQSWKIVYKNEDKAAFIDGIDFWNEKEGIVFGDPIHSKMLLLRTEDGGETWKEITSAPLLKEGEASFAASGTTLRCFGKSAVVVATGGSAARLWRSEDKGQTWNVTETKMIQGAQGRGIFSMAFQQNKAILVGGDFENDKSQPDQSFYSLDHGKTWKPSDTFVRGWRECVEFLDHNTWITTGPGGMEISSDNGQNWIPFSDEKDFHVIRKARKGKRVVAVGNKKIAIIHP